MKFLPIFYNKKEPTFYLLESLYDEYLPNCLAAIKDIETNITHEIRLKKEWVSNHLISESDLEVVILPKDVIKMIDINFFERF